MTDDHRHGLKLGARELRAMTGEQDLNLLMGFALLGVRFGGTRYEHLHEQRLVLGVQVRFRLLDELGTGPDRGATEANSSSAAMNSRLL